MFTGIIQTTANVCEHNQQDGKARLCVEVATPIRASLGSSVSVTGVCLTVSAKNGKKLWFDVMEDTVKKTRIGLLKGGEAVNIEAPLRLGDEVGGHFVFGHVDAIGEIKEITKLRNSWRITIEIPKKLMKYIVPQGSVAIDGVSLTVASVGKGVFSVSLVDYTLKHTALKFLKKGDTVNVECDMLAKYAQRR